MPQVDHLSAEKEEESLQTMPKSISIDTSQTYHILSLQDVNV